MLKVKAVSIGFHSSMKTMQYFKHDIWSYTFFTSLLMLIVQLVMMAPLKNSILDMFCLLFCSIWDEVTVRWGWQCNFHWCAWRRCGTCLMSPHKPRQGRTHLFLLAIRAASSVGTERCLVPVIVHEHDVSRFIIQHFDCCRTKPVCKMFFLTDFLMCSKDHYLGLKWFCFFIWLNSISASGLFIF